jgi:exonuclease VII small subunit
MGARGGLPTAYSALLYRISSRGLPNAVKTLDHAIARLDAALNQLEAAAQWRLDSEKRRTEMETELTLMQDDRARLAMELDAALAQLKRVEGAADEAGRRLDLAMATIGDVLARSAMAEE